MRILQSTLTVEGPIKHATVGRTLASRMSLVVLLALLNVSNHSLINAGQISSHGMLTSFPCFLTEGASADVRDRLADDGNAEAISETTERIRSSRVNQSLRSQFKIYNLGLNQILF